MKMSDQRLVGRIQNGNVGLGRYRPETDREGQLLARPAQVGAYEGRDPRSSCPGFSLFGPFPYAHSARRPFSASGHATISLDLSHTAVVNNRQAIGDPEWLSPNCPDSNSELWMRFGPEENARFAKF